MKQPETSASTYSIMYASFFQGRVKLVGILKQAVPGLSKRAHHTESASSEQQRVAEIE
jgi:hypothetical protein